MSTVKRPKKEGENPARCPVCNGLMWLIKGRYRCFDCEYEPPIEKKKVN